LVRDRYTLTEAAAALHIPALWFEREATPGLGGEPAEPEAFTHIGARKMLVWLDASKDANQQSEAALTRWLDDLPLR
jgi:hypothetical protein